MKTVKFSEIEVKQHFFGIPSNHEYIKISKKEAFCFNDFDTYTFNENNNVEIAEPKRSLLDRKNPVYAYVGHSEEGLEKRIVNKDKRIITCDLGEFGCLAVYGGDEQAWLAGESIGMSYWKYFTYCDEVDEKEPTPTQEEINRVLDYLRKENK